MALWVIQWFRLRKRVGPSQGHTEQVPVAHFTGGETGTQREKRTGPGPWQEEIVRWLSLCEA